MTYTIGAATFQTKDEAVEHCRAILYRQPMDTAIEDDYAEFVSAVFQLRHDKVAELAGRTVIRFLRKKHRYPSLCFFAELSDGSLLDFSFRKVINSLERSS
ncbi:DUF3223 domain-containing protein [Sinorhizobium medicae]|nr:DUF3223 domain-containing protein [Sinorhizobium medicae]MDX0872474.1 DUF3223 domain-containing protein [Sinorhizobium medicae]